MRRLPMVGQTALRVAEKNDFIMLIKASISILTLDAD